MEKSCISGVVFRRLRAYSLAVEEKDEHQEAGNFRVCIYAELWHWQGRGSAWTLGDSHAAACVRCPGCARDQSRFLDCCSFTSPHRQWSRLRC